MLNTNLSGITVNLDRQLWSFLFTKKITPTMRDSRLDSDFIFGIQLQCKGKGSRLVSKLNVDGLLWKVSADQPIFSLLSYSDTGWQYLSIYFAHHRVDWIAAETRIMSWVWFVEKYWHQFVAGICNRVLENNKHHVS